MNTMLTYPWLTILDLQRSVIPPWYDDLMKANMTWLVERYSDGIKLVEKWYEDLPTDVKQNIDNVLANR